MLQILSCAFWLSICLWEMSIQMLWPLSNQIVCFICWYWVVWVLYIYWIFSSVNLLGCFRLFATPWTAACQVSLSITNFRSLLKLMFIESVMLSNHLILSHPLFLLPSIFSNIRSFQMSQFFASGAQSIGASASASASVLPMNIQNWFFFRMDWLDLLAVQGTLKSLLQHHTSKALILWLSAFFIVQLSHPYVTTGKTIALTRRTFVGKVMSLLLN